MRTLSLCAVAIGCLALAPVAEAVTVNDFTAQTYTDTQGHSLPYRLFVPKGYDASHKYPLVLFLHGVGESGTDNEKQITGQPAGPLLFADEQNQAKHPCFVLAPQCPTDIHWTSVPFSQGPFDQSKHPITWALRDVLEVVNSLSKSYKLDTDRLYVTGNSMGGYATWYLIADNPKLFAVAVPVCGGGDPSRAAKLKGIGLWAFHNADDPVVPVSGSRAMVQALRDAHIPATYSEEASGGHASWYRAYATPGLVDWVFAHARGTSLPRTKSWSLPHRPEAPIAPVLTATSIPGGVRLSWELVGGAQSYSVFRAASGSSRFELVADEVSIPNDTDPRLNATGAYRYYVRANGPQLIGPASNTVTAAPGASPAPAGAH